MNQIVIAKDSLAYAAKQGGGTIASIYEINLLADGAIAVFTDKEELVTAANVGTILIDKKGISIAVGSGDATKGAFKTIVTRRLGANYVKKAYVAPVKQKTFIGNDGATGALNLPTLVAGAEAFIKIENTSLGLRQMGAVYTNEIKSYTYVVQTGDTAAVIIPALVAAINNDLDSMVVAAVVGSNVGISLTAKDFGKTFEIALDGILISSTKIKNGTSNSLAVNYGEGTDYQITAIEDLFSAQRGNTNKIHLASKYWTVPSMVVTGKTYDTYDITWTGKHERATGSQNTVNHEIKVALPVGVTAQTTFETIMAQVFGVAEEEESGA